MSEFSNVLNGANGKTVEPAPTAPPGADVSREPCGDVPKQGSLEFETTN